MSRLRFWLTTLALPDRGDEPHAARRLARWWDRAPELLEGTLSGSLRRPEPVRLRA